MSLYRMTNVPVKDDKLTIAIEIDDIGNIRFWQAKASDPDNREHWWGIADIFVGDHMFEPDRRNMLRKMYGEDVVTALNRGIQLGYAKAQADIRNALGMKS